MIERLIELDTRLFLLINSWHSEFLDGPMVWISGKTTWWPFYLALLIYIGYRKRWQLAPFILFIALVITLADQSSVHLFKNVFERLRPSNTPELEGMVHLVNGYRGGGFSFVSSHAANSFAVAALVFLWMKERWLTIVMLVWASLVAYSRIYLGVHFPADVLFGALWGLLCGLLIHLLQLRIFAFWPLKKS